jgi:AAA15 family ATPase/GTPase
MSPAKPSKRRRVKVEEESLAPNFRQHDLYLSVRGFKAVYDEIEIRVAPLTLISGTNSAGKSSFIQPFLVMKQTLESGFDPGALLLYGPNAKFTLSNQTLSRGKSRNSQAESFSVGLRSGQSSRRITYRPTIDGYEIESDIAKVGDSEIVLSQSMQSSSIEPLMKDFSSKNEFILSALKDSSLMNRFDKITYGVQRDGCFLDVAMFLESDNGRRMNLSLSPIELSTNVWSDQLRRIIHVPGLRGNPEREYARSAVGTSFPGTFETYVASILLEWASKSPAKMDLLSFELERLGLTWKAMGRKKNDAAVEVLVGRMPHPQQGGAQDMVSVADVGFGVSQTLPVIISLLVAEPGQIVYLEQPEIHLHPRAQVVLAQALVDAANRGVKVIAETHSSLLIRAVQTQIAERRISAKRVSMNWFSRDENSGFSRLDVADLDDEGRFGDWPLDFDEVAQEADLAYINALRKQRS